MSFLADVRFTRAYLAVGLAAVVGYHWVGGDVSYWAIACYGAVGSLLGALRMPRAERLPWLVLAAAILLWVAGDIEWEVEAMLGHTPASPSISDGIYLTAYPLAALALALLARRAGSDAGAVVDSVIIATTIATALWPWLFATLLHGDARSLATRLTVGVYPCWDILILVLAIRVALTRTLHSRRVALLLASIAVFFVGDLFWFDSVNTYVLGDWMDYMWLAAYVGFAGAALHPSPVARQGEPTLSAFRRYLSLACPVALLPAAIIAEGLSGRRFTVVDGALVSGLLLLLIGRLGAVVRGLEATRAELREQNRLKDELISVVSHDLRTPLTSIMGYLELALADETDPADRRDFLEVVRRNTARLHRLVEDLLFVSRVQGGAQALEIGPVDVGAIADETVAAVRPTAEAAEVRLACRVESHAVVLADGHRIAEVLENLLSNAIKFTPPGGDVDVWVGRSVSALALRVTDTGVGISEQDRDHLFDRFFRARGSDGVPGAGLGLSIVKAIVDAHGGRIEVTSRVGAGTSFEVRLPIAVAEQRAPAITVSGDGASTLVRMA